VSSEIIDHEGHEGTRRELVDKKFLTNDFSGLPEDLFLREPSWLMIFALSRGTLNQIAPVSPEI